MAKKSNTPQIKGTHYCNLPITKKRQFSNEVTQKRQELILVSDKKWANGTTLHYYFYDNETDGQEVIYNDGTKEFITWKGGNKEKDTVRKAFAMWKALGIGLEFKEVKNAFDSEIRIGFMKGDGSWSYLGRDVLRQGFNMRTMNFGWIISDDIDTALHEIGHTLGFPHEHQNPNAGIVWDEAAVYRILAGAPNFWDEQTTFNNIIRKIVPDTVRGSAWDPNSIMHYQFQAGMILKPEEYNKGLIPNPGLSPRDIEYTKFFYPELEQSDFLALQPAKSETMALGFGKQQNFTFKPTSSRKYHIKTYGEMDGVMVLFKKGPDGELIYLSGDDDSGEKKTAEIEHKLLKGEEYVITYRQFYCTGKESAIMLY